MNMKTELRLNAKELRKNLDITRISDNAVKIIRENNFYKTSNHVMLFYPTKYEINLLALLDDEKNFYLPRVNGKNLEICTYKNGDVLKLSDLHIKEPQTEPVEPDIIDLVIVPALMVDKNKFRLGYGGGYYDRFLVDKKFKTLCVIPKELYVNDLPKEDYDIPLDEIVVI